MVLLDTGTPGTSREIYSEDAGGETPTRNPWIMPFISLSISQEFLCPVEPLYFSDEKSITVEK